MMSLKRAASTGHLPAKRGLGVPIGGHRPLGAFWDDWVKQALALSPDQQPLYLIPVGHPR
jgi:hypothetical protein